MKTVKIEGMMCQNCARHAKEALEALGLKAEVILEEKKAIVTGNATNEAIIEAIDNAGYEVVGIE